LELACADSGKKVLGEKAMIDPLMQFRHR